MNHQNTQHQSHGNRTQSGGERALQHENDTGANTFLSQAMPRPGEYEVRVQPAPSSRSYGRLLALVVVLIIVTIGMALCLFYLASTRDTVHAESMGGLLAPLFHLPLARVFLIGCLFIGVCLVLFFGGRSLYTLTRPKKSGTNVLLYSTAMVSDSVRANSYTTPNNPTTDETFQTISPGVLAERILMQIYAQALEVPAEQIKGTTHFFDMGGDSGALETLLVGVARRLHITLSPDEVFNHPVLYHLAAVIIQKKYRQQHEHEESRVGRRGGGGEVSGAI